MDSRKSPAEWNSSQNPEPGQPLLLLQQDPPEYSDAGFSPSHNFPSSSQQYGAPAASGLYTPGSYPVQNVVNMQPTAEVFTPLTNPLPDYLGYSIFTLLCCCMPLGSAALVYSLTTRDANMFGHRQIASRNSRMARIINHVSVAVGLIFCLIFVVYIIFAAIVAVRIHSIRP
ncbi:synapse differentiation-inducing gene protein 1-like [Onychostoma macrolepis]|uniref:synapse differentiation-inducing gene protein 1-like n=1 Tax=Onychostoma macrolepis TaxID=369639 RepID=UPI00272CC47A|nr:synapse differentiation-inducing gene protein 1-like [Onychostoma macrolepis]